MDGGAHHRWLACPRPSLTVSGPRHPDRLHVWQGRLWKGMIKAVREGRATVEVTHEGMTVRPIDDRPLVKDVIMEDEELDHWPMSAWANPAPDHPLNDRLAEELADATSMDDDEMVACFAWLQDPANGFEEKMPGQYTAEQIEALFEEHTVATYTSWAQLAELWSDDHGGEPVLNSLTRVARQTGNQDVFFELLDALGQEIAETEKDRYWWFHVATLLDGRVFCMERPNALPRNA